MKEIDIVNVHCAPNVIIQDCTQYMLVNMTKFHFQDILGHQNCVWLLDFEGKNKDGILSEKHEMMLAGNGIKRKQKTCRTDQEWKTDGNRNKAFYPRLVLSESQKGGRNFTSNWGFSRQKDYDGKITVKVPPISVIWAVLGRWHFYRMTTRGRTVPCNIKNFQKSWESFNGKIMFV